MATGGVTVYPEPTWRFVNDFHGKQLGTVSKKKLVNLPNWSFTHGKTIMSFQCHIEGRAYWGRGSAGLAATVRPLCK